MHLHGLENYNQGVTPAKDIYNMLKLTVALHIRWERFGFIRFYLSFTWLGKSFYKNWPSYGKVHTRLEL
jgi:alkyl sulfatase BDS1-like metallo-beta-lactamase superfamily hydrolase